MRHAPAFLYVLAIAACSRFGPVYPPRPAPSEGPAFADPEPSRLVVHVAVTAEGLKKALDDAAPRHGEGTFSLLGADRKYAWERGPLDVAFGQGKVTLSTKLDAHVSLPLKTVELPLELRVEAEPIVSSSYAVKLQSVAVHVTSPDTRVVFADRIAGVYAKIEEPVTLALKDFAYDLRPVLTEAYGRLTKPIDIPVGEAHACARLAVLDVEAGPTVLADGLEKDLAIVVAPSIAMPCPTDDRAPPELPPLSNVAAITPGPFTTTIPIAARYDELTKAMAAAFTDGKLFFSKDYPQAYLERPEVYESQGALVLKLHIAGPVHSVVDTDLDGDLYLTGHPAVVDNELRVPDLEPTIETRNFLLSLKAMTAGDGIRDQARAALRLDIGERLHEARAKLGDELTFGTERGCFHGDVDRVEVTGVHPHASYLRVYVAVTARARISAPCASEMTKP
ncbi:MAG TPA: DUF4403 family protein [Polyangiaceae bacterium]